MHLSLHSVTPIFTLSSVSGESLDLLKVFLNILPPLTNSKEQEELMQQLTEFQVVAPTNRRQRGWGQGRPCSNSLSIFIKVGLVSPGGRTLTEFPWL